jgi:hypothetical protein
MFTLPGLLGLLLEYYTKVAALHLVPVVTILFAVAGFGLVLEIRLGIWRPRRCPHVFLALALWIWTLLSVTLNGLPIGRHLNDTTVYMVLFLTLSHGAQTFRALRLIAAWMLAITLFLGVIAIMQASAPFQCVRLMPNLPAGAAGLPDGRSCDSDATCREGEDPGERHMCEKVGPLTTTSIGHGRVRYVGILMDPNELGLVLVISLPFAMAPFAARPSVWRFLLMLAAFGIVVPGVINSGSRTAQVAFITVVLVYVIQRIRWTTVLSGLLLAAPALMLGGRSGGEAEESTLERIDAWSAGFEMLRSSPLWGVGRLQFADRWGMTAHNSFMLATAELGFVGLILWLSIFYTDLKILFLAKRRYRDREDGKLAHAWARALFASLCSVGAGINFLSLSDHPVIWAYLALPGAYYIAVQRHDPEFRVAFGKRDLLAVAGAATLYLGFLKAYLLLHRAG